MWWRKRKDSDLEDEIAAHLEIEAAQQRSHGLDPDAARAAARRAFGNRTRIAEETHDVWRIGWLDNLWQDLRIGLRTLRLSPGFTLAATLVLALGIGPNTALFSIVHAAFFDVLGYPEPDRLVAMYLLGRTEGFMIEHVREMRRQDTIFTSITSQVNSNGLTLGEGEAAVTLAEQMVHPGHLSKTLGIAPFLGRDFLPDEAEAGGPVLILSHKTWSTHFARDPKIIGKQVLLAKAGFGPEPASDPPKVYTIVGVMPPFRGMGETQPAAWTPFVSQRAGQRMRVLLARLRPGATVQQARAVFVANLPPNAIFPSTQVRVAPLRGYQMPETTRTTLWMLGATAAFILLIACSNFASLMIARGAVRQRELATRVALGASNFRLLRQLAVETMLVTCTGVALGIAFAWALVNVLVEQLPAVAAITATAPSLNISVLTAAAAVSVAAGLFFGCLPMWRASRAIGPTRTSLRRFLVAFECAATTALIAPAVVSGHSLWAKTQSTNGMRDMGRVLVMDWFLPFDARGDLPQTFATYREAVARVRALPGVEQVTVSDSALAHPAPARFQLPGRNIADTRRVSVPTLGPNYFPTIGASVIAGRSFDGRDSYTSEQVAMVNEEFIRRFHSHAPALNGYITLEQRSAQGMVWVSRRIVGVYADLIRRDSENRPLPEVAVPAEQPVFGLATTLMVRTSQHLNVVREPLAQLVREINFSRSVPQLQTLDEMASNLALRERGYATVFGLLAALALVLSAFGLYGLMTFLVARRTKEIGVRMAMGATPHRVSSMILKEGLVWATAGVAVGFIGAYFAAQSLQTVLGQTWGLAYYAFAAAALLLIACAAAACWVPALRASRVDPCVALRVD